MEMAARRAYDVAIGSTHRNPPPHRNARPDTAATGYLPAARPGQRGLPVMPTGQSPAAPYGFYVQRDKGLHCARIAAQVEHGELADVIWGNHLAVEDDLDRLGEVRSLADWISAPLPVGDEDTEAPMPVRHRHR